MANTFSQLLSGQRVGMDKMVVGTAPKKSNQTGIDLTVAVFFDGTSNNRNNTAQRHMSQYNRRHPTQPQLDEDGIQWTHSYEQEGAADNSYANGYSNVSILERLNRRRTLERHEISLYIEGIGTADNEGDARMGSGIGTGDTGIWAKVGAGASRLADEITKIVILEGNASVTHITLSVFGFSRGSAAARHFASLVRHPTRPLAARLGTPQAKITVRFVGVFDTVSSHGLFFGDDLEELGLRLGTLPEHIVHLTAGDEQRDNFALTDITSSLGVGYELQLPGVHSDVGGGYGEVEDESRELRPGDQARLLAQGWYRPEEIKKHYTLMLRTTHVSLLEMTSRRAEKACFQQTGSSAA